MRFTKIRKPVRVYNLKQKQFFASPSMNVKETALDGHGRCYNGVRLRLCRTGPLISPSATSCIIFD